jgi:hypothetical protein
MEGGTVGHNFERDPLRGHPCQVWFNLVQWFQRRRFKCDLLSKYALFTWPKAMWAFAITCRPSVVRCKLSHFNLLRNHWANCNQTLVEWWGEDLNVIFYQNMPYLHNWYKSADRKISQKSQEYMLNYSLPCRLKF